MSTPTQAGLGAPGPLAEEKAKGRGHDKYFTLIGLEPTIPAAARFLPSYPPIAPPGT